MMADEWKGEAILRDLPELRVQGENPNLSMTCHKPEAHYETVTSAIQTI